MIWPNVKGSSSDSSASFDGGPGNTRRVGLAGQARPAVSLLQPSFRRFLQGPLPRIKCFQIARRHCDQQLCGACVSQLMAMAAIRNSQETTRCPGDRLIESVLPIVPAAPQRRVLCIGRIPCVMRVDCRLIHFSCWQIVGSLAQTVVHTRAPRVCDSPQIGLCQMPDQSQQHRHVSWRWLAAQKWRSFAWAATLRNALKHAARWRSLSEEANGPRQRSIVRRPKVQSKQRPDPHRSRNRDVLSCAV